ncbi:MAG: DNA-binding protein [Bacteroidaceae bacterium]|nr:DNA-binding protein [Bacteroidaceae bacterium]MBR1755002.1 DNA-binding protein [Bacteroidaceae bacterium]
MIPYSIVMRQNPAHPDEPKKAYATAQVIEVLTLQKFAEHISSHGAKYAEEDITAVAILLTKCLVEQLLEGKKVQLGKLGEFSVSLSSEGAPTAKAFTAENIKSVNLIYNPGSAFEDLIKKASFAPVATRAAQAAALKAQKEGLTTADWTPLTDPEPTDDGGNGGTDNSGDSGATTDEPAEGGE